MAPNPARSSTGKAIRRNHMRDLSAKGCISRARAAGRIQGSQRSKTAPLVEGAIDSAPARYVKMPAL